MVVDEAPEDADWVEWSTDALASAAEAGPLYVNLVVYAEVSIRFSRIGPRGRALAG